MEIKQKNSESNQNIDKKNAQVNTGSGNKLRVICLAILSILCFSFTYFHHGWAEYDQKKVLDFKTIIEESVYENPHVLAKVKYKNQIWTVYLAPTSRMTARGVSSDMISKGTAVRLIAYPHKSKKTEMRAERIFVDNVKYELR